MAYSRSTEGTPRCHVDVSEIPRTAWTTATTIRRPSAVSNTSISGCQATACIPRKAGPEELAVHLLHPFQHRAGPQPISSRSDWSPAIFWASAPNR